MPKFAPPHNPDDPESALFHAVHALLRTIEHTQYYGGLRALLTSCEFGPQGETTVDEHIHHCHVVLAEALRAGYSLQRRLDYFLALGQETLAALEPSNAHDPGTQCYAPHCARHTSTVVRSFDEWSAHLESLGIPVHNVVCMPQHYPCLVTHLTERYISHGCVVPEFLYPSAALAELMDAQDAATLDDWHATWGLPRCVDTEEELLAVFGQHYPLARPNRLEGLPTHYPCRVLEFLAPEFPMPASFRGVYQYDV